MLKTSELSGAHLDYWVARAEGIPADQLEIRLIPIPENRHLAPGGLICTRNYHESIDYSTDWAQGGPLIEKHGLDLIRSITPSAAYHVLAPSPNDWVHGGETALIAICRAVVRAAFGNEVQEITP